MLRKRTKNRVSASIPYWLLLFAWGTLCTCNTLFASQPAALGLETATQLNKESQTATICQNVDNAVHKSQMPTSEELSVRRKLFLSLWVQESQKLATGTLIFFDDQTHQQKYPSHMLWTSLEPNNIIKSTIKEREYLQMNGFSYAVHCTYAELSSKNGLCSPMRSQKRWSWRPSNFPKNTKQNISSHSTQCITTMPWKH